MHSIFKQNSFLYLDEQSESIYLYILLHIHSNYIIITHLQSKAENYLFFSSSYCVFSNTQPYIILHSGLAYTVMPIYLFVQFDTLFNGVKYLLF